MELRTNLPMLAASDLKISDVALSNSLSNAAVHHDGVAAKIAMLCVPVPRPWGRPCPSPRGGASPSPSPLYRGPPGGAPSPIPSGAHNSDLDTIRLGPLHDSELAACQ